MPRMSANASKSCVSVAHGIEAARPESDASGSIFRRARSISPRRSRTAAISPAEIRAPPRLARLRSLSSNDLGPEDVPAS